MSHLQTAIGGVLLALIFVASVSSRPQVWNIGFHPKDNQTQSTTPQTIDSTTTANSSSISPRSTTAPPGNPFQEYYDCLARCPVTSEYDPICGSNQASYTNIGKLRCAAQCGTNVTMVRSGPCSG